MIGSFLNAFIYRVPRGINIAFPRSSCTRCTHQISWYENIPILSYAFLGGKCSSCKLPISFRYPFIELLVAFASLFMGPSNPFQTGAMLNYIFFFSIFCVFLSHFLIDLEHKILPNSLNAYLALLFLAVAITSKPLSEWGLGLAIGFGFPYLVTWGFYLMRGQQGLGGGDIKLFAALGIYLGPMGILQNIFLSCFLGSIVGVLLIISGIMGRQNTLPFGPYIILVAAFQIFFPEAYRVFIGSFLS